MVRHFLFASLIAMTGTLQTLRADTPAAGQTAPAKETQPAGASVKVAVPVFRFDGALTESPAEEQMPLFEAPGTSLKEVLDRMRKAAKDPAVKVVVIATEGIGAGPAQAEEIRQAIADLRSAGKEVYAHADSMSMRDYIVLSAASRLSVTPTADVWLNGIHGEAPYLRGMLDKLGVEPDFLTCGDYKSAGEIFMRTGPSKQADEMTNWLLDSLYESWVKQIAASRKMDAEQVKQRIDAGLYSAEKAKTAGLVDAVEHRQEFEALVRNKVGGAATFDSKYGKPEGKKLDLSSPMAAFKIWGELLAGPKEKKPSGPSVAIVYVEGMIVPGSKQPSLFGGAAATSSDIRRALDKAAEDDTVKAVVLRVNSPGGSAVASEIILDATKRVKAKKPFVVSMGDVAGSGGYYVACGSDTIFADETTITASIGVVAGKLVTNGMWDKVGITFKEYNRGKNAALLSTSSKFSDEQRATLQGWMDEVYGVFKNHVTTARGDRLKKPIDEIAGGRVFTGRQALELGLVDQIGTMGDAVKHVAKQANLAEGYTVRVVPEPKNFVEMLMQSLSGEKPDDEGKHVAIGASALRFAPTTPVNITELAVPYLQQMDPQRVGAVRTALQRLDLVQQEGVILAMPEFIVRE